MAGPFEKLAPPGYASVAAIAAEQAIADSRLDREAVLPFDVRDHQPHVRGRIRARVAVGRRNGGEGARSEFDPRRNLVVPFDAEASYLYFLLKAVEASAANPPFAVPPSDYGYMPLNQKTLCCQKLDVVRSWIEAGALPR